MGENGCGMLWFTIGAMLLITQSGKEEGDSNWLGLSEVVSFIKMLLYFT
jgi:hypothetical protein